MADAAAEYPVLFTTEGLPTDFVAQLRAAVGEFEDVIVARNASQVRRMVATQGIRDTLARARGVAKVLDALVAKQLGRRKELLAEWNQMKRIRRRPGRPKGR